MLDLRVWLQLTGAGLLALAFASCEESEPVDCGATDALYQQRIAPLFEEDRPKSCNQCHLSGIDLGTFAKGDPCDTMACMVERGLVDLAAPESSLVLQWIDRAAPASEGITAEVIAEERAGFLAWIEATARCGTCSQSPTPCGTDPADFADCQLEQGTPEEIMAADPGDCSDKTLEQLFLDTFFPWRGRCMPCHLEGTEKDIPEPPKWLAVGPCETASLATMRNVVKSGYLDVEEPANSLWLTKPIEPDMGGVEHGGGDKIHDFDDPLYRMMLYFAARHAACFGG